MKTTVIFGAGQSGKALMALLSTDYTVLAYADNDGGKQGNSIGEIPVLSIQQALELNPDCIWVATLNSDAEQQISGQLRAAGFGGEIKSIGMLKNDIDQRVATLRMFAAQAEARGISGDVAELGVYKGDFASEINRCFPDRKLYLFDTFEGFAAEDIAAEEHLYTLQQPTSSMQPDTLRRRMDFSDTNAELVLSRLPKPELAQVYKGRFPENVPTEKGLVFAFVSLDADLYAPTLSGLEWFYPRMSKGGAIIVHDYGSDQFPGVRLAVDEFMQQHCIFNFPISDMHGSTAILKV